MGYINDCAVGRGDPVECAAGGSARLVSQSGREAWIDSEKIWAQHQRRGPAATQWAVEPKCVISQVVTLPGYSAYLLHLVCLKHHLVL